MLHEKKISEYYKKYSRELYIYLLRFTGSKETSEDLLHDVFISLIKFAGKKEIDDSSVRALLYKIAHNSSINYIKHRSKIKTDDIDSVKEASSGDLVEEQIILDELNREISSILNSFDPEIKSIFIMKKELGLTTAEIAENTGFSERSVRRKLESALNIIYDRLKKSGFLAFLFFALSIFTQLIVILKRGFFA